MKAKYKNITIVEALNQRFAMYPVTWKIKGDICVVSIVGIPESFVHADVTNWDTVLPAIKKCFVNYLSYTDNGTVPVLNMDFIDIEHIDGSKSFIMVDFKEEVFPGITEKDIADLNSELEKTQKEEDSESTRLCYELSPEGSKDTIDYSDIATVRFTLKMTDVKPYIPEEPKNLFEFMEGCIVDIPEQTLKYIQADNDRADLFSKICLANFMTCLQQVIGNKLR